MKNILFALFLVLTVRSFGQMTVESGAGQLIMRVTNDGKVGIGMSAPAASLDVAGAVQAASGYPVPNQSNQSGYSFQGDADTGLFSPADGTVSLVTANQPRLTLTFGGRIGIGTTVANSWLVIGQNLGNGVATNPCLVLHTSQQKDGVVVGLDDNNYLKFGFDYNQEFASFSYGSSVLGDASQNTDYDHTLVFKDGKVGIGTTDLQSDALSVASDFYIDDIKAAEQRPVEVDAQGNLVQGSTSGPGHGTEHLVSAHIEEPFTAPVRFEHVRIENWINDYDPFNMYHGSDHAWQIPKTGFYQIYSSVEYVPYIFPLWWNWFATLMLRVVWGTDPNTAVNDLQTWQANYANIGEVITPKNETLVYLTAGDYVWITAGINTGGYLTGGRVSINYLGDKINGD